MPSQQSQEHHFPSEDSTGHTLRYTECFEKVWQLACLFLFTLTPYSSVASCKILNYYIMLLKRQLLLSCTMTTRMRSNFQLFSMQYSFTSGVMIIWVCNLWKKNLDVFWMTPGRQWLMYIHVTYSMLHYRHNCISIYTMTIMRSNISMVTSNTHTF